MLDYNCIPTGKMEKTTWSSLDYLGKTVPDGLKPISSHWLNQSTQLRTGHVGRLATSGTIFLWCNCKMMIMTYFR